MMLELVPELGVDINAGFKFLLINSAQVGSCLEMLSSGCTRPWSNTVNFRIDCCFAANAYVTPVSFRYPNR